MFINTRCRPLAVSIISASLMAAGSTVFAAEKLLEEVIVTAQKRAESLTDVPIAVSAFTAQDITAKQVRTGVDLQNYVPNLSFTGSVGGSAGDFAIRGIGASNFGSTGDAGVGLHQDNIPLVVSRSANGELYDLAQVEVLRGPQGTLFGRNATGGVINYITAKPKLDSFEGYIKGEVGNFSAKKMNGAINVPVGDTLAVRLAASWLDRDGYTKNTATGNRVDGRDEWSTRLAITFAPTDRLTSTVSWEHFEEDSSRNGGARSFCVSDPGPDMVGSTPILNDAAKLFLSRGCDTGSIYGNNANGNPNSVSTFGGRYAYVLANVSPVLAGLVPGDVFTGQVQSSDLRETSYFIDPQYEVENDFVSWDTRFSVTDELELNLLLGWAEDTQYSRSGSREAEIGFADTPVTPGGVYTDFQSGAATGVRTLNIGDRHTEQYSAELRLASNFDGPLNFNVGAFYFDVERYNVTFVSTNSTSLFARAVSFPIYFDESPDPRDSGYSGHQYFAVPAPYELESKALFGEFYWQAKQDLKVTLGLRYTDDEKRTDNTPSLLFVPQGTDGIATAGHAPGAISPLEVSFEEWTGRLVVDWMPNLSFTEQTLVYASYSRGYKAGGFNPPTETNPNNKPYEPEFVDAYEIGTKNTLADGRAQLNLAAYYYDYEGYQVSFLEESGANNTNVDAVSMGVELESQYVWDNGFGIDLVAGWQDTEIKNGSSYDPFDRTGGDPDLSYLVTPLGGCVVDTAALESAVGLINAGVLPAVVLASTSFTGGDACQGAFADSLGLVPSSGKEANIDGNELPHAPQFSYSIGLSYEMAVQDWTTVFRLDYSWKDETYVSHFNGENYELDSWDNANFSITASQNDGGLVVQAFVKNLMDSDDTVINYSVSSQGVGLTRPATLLPPRLYGVSVNWEF